jgi:hypothetical protein
MRETKRVRATLQRVPFPGQPSKYLPGPRKEVDPDTGDVRVVPGTPMSVPWTPYWRQRLEQKLIELAPSEPEPAAPLALETSVLEAPAKDEE